MPIQQWPDFRKWDDRSEFKLYEAAALWFDAEPRLPMWWHARRKARHWRLMIASGAGPESPSEMLGIQFATDTPVTPHTRIPRETLKAWAEKEGKKPLFLFPERRSATTYSPR
jgi:hypothetical protein